MGLNDNTKNIEIALTEKNRLQKEREAERRRKQEEKEDLQRLEYDVKECIKREIEKYLNIAGIDYITEFYSNVRKYEILNEIIRILSKKKTVKNMATGKTMTIYTEQRQIKEIFDKNYYKILKEEEKIYKLNDKYLYYKQLQEAEVKPIQKQKNDNSIIWKTIGTILLTIFCFPIAFILLIVMATIKKSK